MNNQVAAAKEAGVSAERFRRFLREHKLAERAGSPGGATPRGTEHFKLESHEAVDTGATKSSVSSMAYRRRLAAELAYAT